MCRKDNFGQVASATMDQNMSFFYQHIFFFKNQNEPTKQFKKMKEAVTG
jgi:hypothetical protein